MARPIASAMGYLGNFLRFEDYFCHIGKATQRSYLQSLTKIPGTPLILLVRILVVLLILPSQGCSRDSPETTQERSRPLPAVAAYEVSPRDMSRVLEFSGTLQALQRVQMSTALGGILTIVVERREDVLAIPTD